MKPITMCLLCLAGAAATSAADDLRLLRYPEAEKLFVEKVEGFAAKLPGREKTQTKLEPVDEPSRRRGFVVFHRPLVQTVWPESIPHHAERVGTFSVAAAIGESEPLPVAIHARVSWSSDLR